MPRVPLCTRRFRAAVGKVICANRFRWNVDQLRESRLPASHLNGNPGDGSLEAGASDRGISAKLNSVDDAFRRKIHERCNDLLQRISLSCFQCVTVASWLPVPTCSASEPVLAVVLIVEDVWMRYSGAELATATVHRRGLRLLDARNPLLTVCGGCAGTSIAASSKSTS